MALGTSCFVLSLMVSAVLGVATWSYSGSNGPAHWKDMPHSKCGGTHQSPINIDTLAVEHSDTLAAFRVYNFDEIINTTMNNNGHTVTVAVNAGSLRVEGGGLPEPYKPLQFHFHWGINESRGSEHTLNGRRFPMEMHIVCMKQSIQNAQSAIQVSDGLAVLGFFFELSSTNNKAMDGIANQLAGTVKYDSTSILTEFDLDALLPSNLTEYYRYAGSLTTPDCNEAVVWSVFTETIKISAAQLMKFRSLQTSHMKDNEYEHILDNFRPVQSLGDRKVYFRVGVSAGSQMSLPVFIPPLLICVLLHFY